MIKIAGWLIALYGAAHTIGALTVERALRYTSAWFSGQLSGEDLASMSPANCAYWLSLGSFGIPVALIGLTVLWLAQRGIAPPKFIPCTLGIWTLVDGLVLSLSPWPILLLANVLLLIGARRAPQQLRQAAR